MKYKYKMKLNNNKNQSICNIPTFPLVARRFSQPGFGRSGGVENEIIVETVEYNLNYSLLNKDNRKDYNLDDII